MATQNIRSTAVAGMFYPAQANELQEMIESMLSNVAPDLVEKNFRPKAIIAPHAGYVYSGPVAASAYKIIEKISDQISKVILIGPSHRVPLFGFATSSADFFESPLGNIPIDKNAVNIINQLPEVKTFDQAHLLEHSLEVHLPFLKVALKDFSLIPIVAGDATPQEVVELLQQIWGGPETLIIISSDLSHYQDYETARKMDTETCQAIENLDFKKVDSKHACGYVPIKGLLSIAREKNLDALTIDYRNSGDTAGSKDQVVGYGSYVFV